MKTYTKKELFGHKIFICGNGNQAPYGIGEVISVKVAWQLGEIMRFCEKWYNKPTLRLDSNNGKKVEIETLYKKSGEEKLMLISFEE